MRNGRPKGGEAPLSPAGLLTSSQEITVISWRGRPQDQAIYPGRVLFNAGSFPTRAEQVPKPQKLRTGRPSEAYVLKPALSRTLKGPMPNARTRPLHLRPAQGRGVAKAIAGKREISRTNWDIRAASRGPARPASAPPPPLRVSASDLHPARPPSRYEFRGKRDISRTKWDMGAWPGEALGPSPTPPLSPPESIHPRSVSRNNFSWERDIPRTKCDMRADSGHRAARLPLGVPPASLRVSVPALDPSGSPW
jgi:hypothetical protein